MKISDNIAEAMLNSRIWIYSS